MHISHGAFQTDVTTTGWDLNKVLRALFKILDESPARRDVYLKEGTSGKFALKFCETRWIEDDDVAERALEMWGSMVATVKYWEGLSKSKRPRNNTSYDTLVTYHKDLLIPAKLHFFVFIAGILKPYLVVFQTDSPLLPFMYDELFKILIRLLGLIVKKEKLDENNLREIMKEKWLKDTENHLEEFLIDLRAATKDVLNKAKVAVGEKTTIS